MEFMSGLRSEPLCPDPHQQSLVVSEPQPRKSLHLRGVTFGFSKPLQLKKNGRRRTENLPLP